MKIEAQVRLIQNGDKLKGTADIVFDNEFVVKGVRILKGEKGLFWSMPSRKVGDEYKQECFPITAECREHLNQAVMGAYEAKLKVTSNNL